MKRTEYLLFALLSLLPLHLAAAPDIPASTRRRIAETLSRIVGREVAGAPVRITGVDASRSRVRIYASAGLSYYPFREENVAAMRDSVRALLPADYGKARIELYTDHREVGELVPMAFKQLPTKKKLRPVPFVNRAERPLVTALDRPVGAPDAGLAGRHIALWQSHGRFFDQKQNRWRWQRSQLWMTCEDLYTQSYVLPYLVPMLENAGATVLLPRERDVQCVEVLADNDRAEQYREEGGSWSDGGAGFAHLRNVYRTGENPFRDGTTRRAATVSGPKGESRAVWTVEIPEAGDYALYVSYESLPASADEACYTVRHRGGESRFAVNQRMGGGTWVYLGTFPFGAGRQEAVELSNRSRRSGAVVSADAVKIGGGYGNIARSVCDSLRREGETYLEETSGYPRFCEGARYWLQWAGFDEKVYSLRRHTDDYTDDYTARAHWVNALMGGSERLPDSTGLRIPVDMALAFHSDAGVRDGDGIVGTLGIYCTRDNGGRFDGGASRLRSRDLTDLVMTQIVSDIRRTWEPEWSRRGMWNRAYYEARVPAVPTMLLELLSHQNFADMRYGQDPRFRLLVSRAVYKGILRYLASQYGGPVVVQPLPVEAMRTEFVGEEEVRIAWTPVVDSLEPTAAPDGYVVYTRIGEGSFDKGRYTVRPELTIRQIPDSLYSYRVTAVNRGGESLPGETLAACRRRDERGRVLIVNGFDRVSAPPSIRNDSLAGFLCHLDDGVPDRRDISFIGPQHVFDPAQARCERDDEALGACSCDFETDVIGGNTFDYPALHGAAAAAAGYSFCSASARAVERRQTDPAAYDAVDLILGRQRTAGMGRDVREPLFQALPASLRRALGEYLDGGGALFVSGSRALADQWEGAGASEEGRAFVRERLHCLFDGDAGVRRGRVRVVASDADFTRGEYRYHDAPGPDHYTVGPTDALRPAQGAFAVLRYVDNGRTAGVAHAGEGRTFVMGFPFESVRERHRRERLMADILHFLCERTD